MSGAGVRLSMILARSTVAAVAFAACLVALAGPAAAAPSVSLVTELPENNGDDGAPSYGWFGGGVNGGEAEIGPDPDAASANGSARLTTPADGAAIVSSGRRLDPNPSLSLLSQLDYDTRKIDIAASGPATAVPTLILRLQCDPTAAPLNNAIDFRFDPYDQVAPSYDFNQWTTWHAGADEALYTTAGYITPTGISTAAVAGAIGGPVPVPLGVLRAAFTTACGVEGVAYGFDLNQSGTGAPRISLFDHVVVDFTGSEAGGNFDFARTGKYHLTQSPLWGSVAPGGVTAEVTYKIIGDVDAPAVPHEYLSVGFAGMQVSSFASCEHRIFDAAWQSVAVIDYDGEPQIIIDGSDFQAFPDSNIDVTVRCTLTADAPTGVFALRAYAWSPYFNGHFADGASSNTEPSDDVLTVAAPVVLPISEPIAGGPALAATGPGDALSQARLALLILLMGGALIAASGTRLARR